MEAIHILLTLLVITLNAFAQPYTDVSHQVVLIEKMTEIPCSNLHSTPSLIAGSSIFTTANIPVATTSIQEMTLTNMFIPQGFYNKDYTLFSIHDRSTLLLIYSLSYNPITNALIHNLKGSIISFVPTTAIKDNWCYIKVIINLDASSVSDVISWEMLIASTYSTINTQTIPGGGISSFLRDDIIFNIGYSSYQLMQSPACSEYRYMVLYLSEQPLIDTTHSWYHSKLAVDTKIIQHIDAFYTQNNESYSFTCDIFDRFQLGGGPLFLFKQNLSVDNGLTFAFQIKIPSSADMLLYILNPIDVSLFIHFQLDSSQNIYACLLGGVVSFNSIGLTVNKWYQFVLVIENSPFKKIATLIFIHASVKYAIPITFTTQIQYLQPTFTIPNTNNLRSYLGTFLVETASCLLETGRKQKHCLLCKDNYYLKYETGSMQCIHNSTPGVASSDGISVDWIRGSCGVEKMHQHYDSVCYCQFNKYVGMTGTCELCPIYFRGCTTFTTAIEKDPNRIIVGSFGVCDNDMFDDNYNCISRDSNQGKQIETLFDSNESTYYMRNSKLLLSATDSIFFSFIVDPFLAPLTNTQECVAYFVDNAQQLFTIVIEFTIVDSISRVVLYHYTTKIAQFEFDYTVFVKIGLWADNVKAIPIIETQGYTMTETLTLFPSSLNHSNPSLCIGICYQSNPLFSASTKTIKSKSISYAKGSQESKLMGETWEIKPNEPSIILEFQFEIKKQIGLHTFLTTSTYAPTNSEIFVSTNGLVDPLKGLQNGFGGISSIPNTINTGKIISFSFNFTPQTAYYLKAEYTLISFYLDSVQVQIRMILAKLRLPLEICIDKTCYVIPNCEFRDPLSSFVLIQMKKLDNHPTTLRLKILSICNYSRQETTFVKKLINGSISNFAMSSITFFDQVTNIYFNNIRFYTDLGISIDYEKTNGCFIYSSLHKYCIKAKPDFAIWKGQPLLPSLCPYQTSDTGSLIIFNPYTQECQDMNIFDPKCQVVKPEDLVTCLECKDTNADTNNNCYCKNGYYYPPNSYTCHQCQLKCLTCTENNECLTCKNSGSNLPGCECSTNQFFDSSYYCQNCQEKCSSCSGSASDCLTCAKNRVNPPTCNCDSQYYDQVASTISECIPLTCADQCDSCEYSSTNCTVCAIGRSLPPACNCQTNYFEVNGNCVQCPQHKYYDTITNSCKECYSFCLNCVGTSTTCTECPDELTLIGTSCLCSDSKEPTKSSSGIYLCSNYMDTKLTVDSSNNAIRLIFAFEDDLDSIDFDTISVNDLLFVYIQSALTTSYTLKDPVIEGHTFTARISFKQSISTSGGSVFFKDPSKFKSSTINKSLNPKYEQDTFQFKVGPIVLQDDLYEPNKGIQQFANAIEQIDTDLMDIIRQSSIILLLVNTLQPSMTLLLLKVQVPPNLFQLLQTMGLLMFPQVPQFASFEPKYEYSFLGTKLEIDKDFALNDSEQFKKVGYSDSMILNVPIVILQNLLWPCLILVIAMLKLYLPRLLEFKIVLSILSLCKKQIFAVSESTLLIIMISVTNQTLNYHDQIFFSRWSFYLAFVLIGVLIKFQVDLYKELKFHLTNRTEQATNLLDKFSVNDSNSNKILYFITAQRWKKILLAFGLVYLEDMPEIVCLTYSLLMLGSIIATIVLNPYKNRILQAVRIIGDVSVALIYLIYLFQFIPFEYKLYENLTNVIPEEDMKRVLGYGTIAFVLLALLNLIYIFELIISVIQLINQYLEKRKLSKQNRIAFQKQIEI